MEDQRGPLVPDPELSVMLSLSVITCPFVLTCPRCSSHQSRTLSTEIPLPPKVILRIDEITFVEDSSQHQMESTACIARAAALQAKHHGLCFFLFFASETHDNVHPFTFPTWVSIVKSIELKAEARDAVLRHLGLTCIALISPKKSISFRIYFMWL